MASNFEWELLSRIVRTANLKEALNWGIRSEDFGINQARAVYDFITSLYLSQNTAGTIPGPHTIEVFCPEFQILGDDSVTMDFLCQQVRLGYIERETKAACEKAVEECESNVADAIAGIAARSRQLVELGTSRHCDIGMEDGMQKLMVTYEQQELGLLKAKFQWPWPILNEMTGGVSEEDYVIFYGRPKQMKSWALAHMAAFTVEQDMRILIYTKEMTPGNLLRRIVACALHLPYHEFRFGKLAPEQKALLRDYTAHFANPYSRSNLIMIDGAEINPGGDTVSWLQAKVEKYAPDALFIDGLALLSDEFSKKGQAEHMRVQNISRALRQMCIRKRLPIIATIHANRKAAGHSEGNLDEIAYSDAVAQDATIAIRTIAEKFQATMAMIMAGSREFKLPGFRIHAVVAQNFTEHSVMDEGDVQKVAERDLQGKAQSKARSKGGPTQANLDAKESQLADKHWRAVGL